MISIGIKYKGYVYVSSPSYGFGVTSSSYLKENMSVFAPSKTKNMIASYSGSLRALDVIKFYGDMFYDKDTYDQPLNDVYLIRTVYRGISKYLQYSGLVPEDEACDDIKGGLLVAKNDKLFELTPEGMTTEADDFYALGSNGKEQADALLDMMDKDIDPIYRILKASQAAIHSNNAGAYPIVIMNTKDTKKVLTFDETDTVKYILKYEKEHK